MSDLLFSLYLLFFSLLVVCLFALFVLHRIALLALRDFRRRRNGGA